MSIWGARVYGDPCRECGFDWSMPLDAAASFIDDAPRRYTELLDGQDGAAQHPDLTWTVKAYVCHVADNLRIWAERLWSAVAAEQMHIKPYDPDALAAARGYEHIPAPTALWTLSHAVDAWNESLEVTADSTLAFDHSERGLLSLSDIVESVAHDAMHHEWDICRSLAVAGQSMT